MKRMLVVVLLVGSINIAGWSLEARADQPLHPLQLEEPTAQKQSFDIMPLTGWIESRQVYTAEQSREVLISVTGPKKISYACMSYADFTFDLKKVDGHHIASKDASHMSGMVALPPGGYFVVPPATKPGQAAPCVYRGTYNAIFTLNLDYVYPRLPAGAYELKITFEPTTGVIPAVTFPSVHFSISE